MKRILVIDTAASSGGALTVLQDFYNTVCNSNEDIEWIFLVSGHYIEEKENIKVIVRPELKSHMRRLAFDCFIGRRFVNKINPDVVFSLQNTTLMGVHVPQVVYVHQSVPFQSTYKFSFLKKNERYMAVIQYLLGWFIKCSIRRANRAIVQTKWMKKAVIKQCGIAETNIVQIYPNVTGIKDDNICTYKTTNKFFYPTSNTYYKNIDTLLEACRQLDSEKLKYKLNVTIDGLDTNSIKYLGKISKEEVYNNYKNSCLVFPSYIETFGYPLVEAKECGAIILASDCEFSHELLDDYPNAYFFEPFDSEALSDLMEKVISGIIVRDNNSIKQENKFMDNSWNDIISLLKIE